MPEIKDFLEKFNKILKSDEVEKMVIIDVFKKVLGLDIEKEDILFKKECLLIKSDIYKKTEINLNKKKLIKEINKQGLDRVIKDIK